jgi:hypothetical protein
MVAEVVMVLPVEILPKPEAMDPEAKAPTLVRDETVTPEPRVVAFKTEVLLI